MNSKYSTQQWSSDQYQRNARFVSDLGSGVLNWLNPKAGEAILDLGCGDGALTKKLTLSGANVLGVDTSQDFIDTALKQGLNVLYMDGHDLNFDHEFDAVFSNAALHWMTRPDDVLNGVRNALKSGGRFVGEFGGHGNVAAIVTALRAVGMTYHANIDLANPWFFPTADEYREMLTHHGFDVRRIQLIPRPTPLPTGISGWLQTFSAGFFSQFTEQVRHNVLEDLENLLRPSLCDSRGKWTADYVRLRFEATVGR